MRKYTVLLAALRYTTLYAIMIRTSWTGSPTRAAVVRNAAGRPVAGPVAQ